MAELTMRPLSLGELLDRSFAVLRTCFAPMLLTGLICLLLPLALILASLPEMASMAAFNGVQSRGAAPPVDQVLALFSRFLWIGLAAFACYTVARGAWVWVTAEAIEGRRSSVGEALRRGVRMWASMLGLGLVEAGIFLGVYLVGAIPLAVVIPLLGSGGVLASATIIGLGVLAFAAFMLWLYAGFYVAAPALVLDAEPGKVFRAIERAWNLSRGRRWVIVAIVILVAILAFVIELAGLFLMSFAGTLFGAGPGTVAPMFVLAYGVLLLIQLGVMLLGYVIQTVMYFDLRVRHEGLDLARAAQSLGGA